jgi:O-antigen biosynthesis protein
LPLLQKNLKQVIIASPEASEVILADDCSGDASLSYASQLQKEFPILKIIHQSSNQGFGKTSNNAVKNCHSDLVVLLNNDILPESFYLSAAIKHFSDPKVFGVGFSEIKHENWARLFWQNGYLQYEPGTNIKKTHISGWISGGSSIIKRDYFLRLGGFDEVYAPFYSEDLDLGYRAWKSGYKLLWEPKSVVAHHHESTMSRFPKRFLDYVKERNRLLTVWRNITDPDLLKENQLFLILRVLSGPNYIKIIRAAKRQIKTTNPPIVFPKLTDKEIFELFK